MVLDEPTKEDIEYESEGLKILADRQVAESVSELYIDFHERWLKSEFTVKNTSAGVCS